MEPDLLDDYRWLVSDDAAVWLRRMEEVPGTLTAQARHLRKHLPARRTHILLEQQDLRRRAVSKFENANRMFFTRRSLEQATDQWLAKLKARRFPEDQSVADLCCGIGGDLIGLAGRTDVTAIDRDPVLTMLAEVNCRNLEVPLSSAVTMNATDVQIDQFGAWHIDPDRRPTGHRTTQPDYSEPSASVIERLLHKNPHAAIKLAPAARLTADWVHDAERQWLGSGRECRQQVAWLGDLAEHPACHSAAVTNYKGGTSDLLVGMPDGPVHVAPGVAQYVFEPHTVVLAAGLTSVLARKHDLYAVAAEVAYLTGDQLVRDMLLDAFLVIDTIPFDERQLRKQLRQMNIGPLEVKKRGISIDPETVRKKLRGNGTHAATLLITPVKGKIHAIIARRLQDGIA